MKVLIANIGSTSYKYRLLDMPAETTLAEGAVERIGRPGGGEACANYKEAIALGFKAMKESRALESLDELGGVGFKAVAARGLTGTQKVDERLLQAMEAYNFLLPAHNPAYVNAMRAFQASLPAKVSMVAVFDSAFFSGLNPAKTTYAVPFEWTEKYQVRRYGFHGASHTFASQRACALRPIPGLRHVSCHLGGSSSLAAIRGGRPEDTSFGMTPQSGIPQNNRVGDLDTFALLYMMKEKNLSVDETAQVLGSQSGLAGMSATSGDLRDLLAEAEKGSVRAKLALEVFIQAIRRHLGAFWLNLGGLDMVTFSGGIGEKSAFVRSAALKGLEGLGLILDEQANADLKGEGKISGQKSSVEVWVIKTNEEIVVAREVYKMVHSNSRT